MKEILTSIQNALPYIIIAFVVVLLIGFAIWWFVFKTKHLKMDNVYFISGGVKTGKSFLSVFLSLVQYAKNRIGYRLRWLILLELNILTFWKIDKIVESFHTPKPMLYSNMNLRYVRFNKFTYDILKRNVRIPNKSVLLLDEISLLADAQNFKDKEINNELMVFFKLWAHYTHGGSVIINSQALSDCHHQIRRTMSRYTYIYSRTKLPFVTLFKVCERVYAEDGSSINVNNGDMERDLLTLVVPNFFYKFYDCYCYSIFTDSLAYQVDYKKTILKRGDSLKCDELVTLQDFSTLDKRSLNNEKE